MKYRYLSIFLLILVLSVGAVCAQDNATGVDVISQSSGDVISVDSNIDIKQANESDDITSFSIDDSNFNNYFDENGTIRESANISDYNVLVLGNISNHKMVLDKILTIIPNDNSILTNVGITLISGSDNSTVRGLTFQNTNGDSAINILNASDIIIAESIISVSSEDTANGLIAISANYAKNLMVSSNYIAYSSKSNGTVGKYSNAIRVIGSDNALISDNVFNINLSSVDVPWNEIPAASGNWVSDPITEGIVVKDSNNLNLSGNNIFLNSTDKVTASGYDTIYVVDINNCKDSLFESNQVIAKGQDYIYGLIVSGENLNIANNTIAVQSLNYACGVDIEGPATATVENNVIGAIAPSSAYAVYSAMSNGNVSVDYINNSIGANAYAAFGMELSGIDANVFENTIEVMGNYTTGIASRVDGFAVVRNNITVTGSGEGNESIWDGFGIDNVGIKVIKGLVIIQNNTIDATGKGILASNVNLTANANDIVVVDTSLSDSYAIYVSNATYVEITDNKINYTGKTNGTFVNDALYVEDSAVETIGGNTFDIAIPSVDVPWPEIPAGSGNYVRLPFSEGIVLKNNINSVFSNNIINLNSTDVITESGYDTIYVVDVDSDNAVVDNNIIAAKGAGYVYGVIVSGNNFTVSNNAIQVESDNYANGIDVEGPAEGVVVDNVIALSSPIVSYGIYAAMSNGNVSVGYANNTIRADSYAAFGMELGGIDANVADNVIELTGNHTTGIVSRVANLAAVGNNITLTGSGEGNEYVWDSFGVDNAAIKVISGSVILENNTIDATGKGIVAFDVNLTVNGNNISVTDTGLADSYAIYVFNATDVTITKNTVDYAGNTNGTNVNNAMYVEDSSIKDISENSFDITIPSAPVNWVETPAGSKNYVSTVISEGIVFDNDTGLKFNDNKINLTASSAIGSYDTLYVIDSKSDNAVISGNDVFANGKSYIYGLIISGENLTVSENDIMSISDTYYANGIDVEGPASGLFDGNNITVISPVVAYGVYSSMSGSDVNATYLNNHILGDADIIYGMELAGTNETAAENLIELAGNKTMGIAGKSATLNILNNQITVAGTNLGNTTLWESFEPETVGVKIIDGNATVYGNNIRSTGVSTVNVTTTNASVTYNYLVSNESFGDASVYFDGNATVHDNLPDYDAFLQTDDLIMYYKDGSRFTAVLVTFDGQPISNKTITFTINGRSYNITTDENGAASIAVNLVAGEYEVTTFFDPGLNKTPSQNANKVTVLSTILADNLVKTFRNASQFYATFLDGEGNPLPAETSVQFNINGVMYYRQTDGNGTAKLNINLVPGTYIITSTNPFNGEEISNNVTVLASITDNNDLVKYYKNDSQYVVTIVGDDGTPVGAGENVTFNINGVMYTRQTNESGQAKLNINLAPGNYTITAIYNGCEVSNNIEVLPVLRANDLVKKYGTSDQFIAYLVDGQGKPYEGQTVNFNINGRFYDRVTDSDGRAALNIKLNAAIDTYIITSSYNGSSISNTIKVEA